MVAGFSCTELSEVDVMIDRVYLDSRVSAVSCRTLDVQDIALSSVFSRQSSRACPVRGGVP